MREHTMAIGRILALVLATTTVILLKPTQTNLRQALKVDVTKHAATVAAVPQASALSLPVPKQPQHTEPPQPVKQPEPAPTPAPPTAWAVETSPNGGIDYVNQALAHYQDMGLTKQGAAMIVGDFLQEMPSAFTTGDPCHSSGTGDGGLALGFGQWHPGRRTDMPCGFIEQLTWAVDTEMARDDGGQVLRPLLFDTGVTADQIDYGIKLWERYGTKGNRYQYGISLLRELQ